LPESNVGVARQYAEAAFQLAVESNSVDRWLAELRLTAEALHDDRVRRALDNPALGEADKSSIVRRSLTSVDPRLLNLVLLLIERRRLRLMEVVASEFARLSDERRGIVLAEVTTAVPLDEPHRAMVAQRLAAALGKQVRLRATVDSSIIGGLVVKVGDRLINGSVAGRLANLRRDLT
jgi:F-type H+-transporting ATPase subunit delta